MLIHSYHVEGKSALRLGHTRPWMGTLLATLKLQVKRFWTEILAELGQRREPQVWQTSDPYGRLSWCAYDPETGKTVENLSEQEVRIWLEGRYR